VASAWVDQDDRQVKLHGSDVASWRACWYDPEGKRRVKSCGPGTRGKRMAERLRRKVEAELLTGTYQSKLDTTWKEFREEYEAKILPGVAPATRYEVTGALDHFEGIVRPGRVAYLATAHVDQYIAARRKQGGKRKGTLVSPATINKELRHLKAVLGKAREWGHLPALPKFHMEKAPKKLSGYIPPEHFAKLYAVCDQAELPDRLPFPAADWWRGLLVTLYLTGWRIGALLALQREDVDLETGVALSQAEDTKGKRDVKTPLHPMIVEHLQRLAAFAPAVFPWRYPVRRLYDEFARLQDLAGVRPEGKRPRYGFHDLRRAFATMNADRLTAEQLQVLMQHKSYQTTLTYISMARQLNPALQNLFVPELPPRTTGQGDAR
jgi:integrase